MGRLFGTDGIRGIVNETLTCELAMALGRAVASTLSKGEKQRAKYLIGMDPRASSDMFCCALAAGVASEGGDVELLGVVPTPAVAYLVEKYEADAGIMVSASHNSAEYNGIKIFNRDGYKLADEIEDRIESIVLDDCAERSICRNRVVGRIVRNQCAERDYIEHLKQTVSVSLDGFSIAIDCANGAAFKTAPKLYGELGAECHVLSAKPDGRNINQNCGSTHLEALRRYVKENHLEIGIAFDGDADRCLCIDSDGRVVDGDEIMALCALDLMQRGKLLKQTVVGTVMTNMGFGRFCDENGIRLLTTAVGDRYVLEEMIREDLSFGGEQSGHIIFREFATTGDGQLTALQLLSLLKRSGKTLRDAARVMKKYPQMILNVPVSESGKLMFHVDDVIQKAIEKEKTVIDGRIVVRVSGTEPLIRVMVECEDEDEAICTARRIAGMIEARLS